MTPSERLAAAHISLPTLATPIGSYVPAKRSGQWLFTSGQLPFKDGRLRASGKVPADVSTEEAAACAETAMLNAISAAALAAGGIDKIAEVVRVTVFVASSQNFHDQPKVANGASDLLTRIFGDQGRHARSAVGVAELPMNAPVEVELLVQLV